MQSECTEEVTHIDEKGYVYCVTHGLMRRMSGIRSRKLRPAETKRLMNGETVSRY